MQVTVADAMLCKLADRPWQTPFAANLRSGRALHYRDMLTEALRRRARETGGASARAGRGRADAQRPDRR